MTNTPAIRSLLLAPVRRIDTLLRGNARIGPTDWPLWQITLIVVFFGFLYGTMMGSYSNPVGRPRMWQAIDSAIKVPLLLLATFGLSVPSFFVLNNLVGLRADFGRAIRALIAAQAGLTVILSSLGPFVCLMYVSGIAYRPAILLNGMMFAISSIAAQVLLRRLYRPLIDRNPRHRTMLRAWLVLYAFVGIQMGWVLRPFIGDPVLPTHFFRHGAWTNAYETIARMVWEQIR
jgi:hypothetical protein